MASQKKVVIRQFDGSLWWGYLPSSQILEGAEVQILDTSGRVRPVALELIKTIAYVKQFNLNDQLEPERVGRRSFPSRPRTEGIWLKMEFRDDDLLEGLAPSDGAFFDRLVEDRCVSVTLPDPKSNTYSMLIPRIALSKIEIIAVLSQPSRRRLVKEGTQLQTDLFS